MYVSYHFVIFSVFVVEQSNMYLIYVHWVYSLQWQCYRCHYFVPSHIQSDSSLMHRHEFWKSATLVCDWWMNSLIHRRSFMSTFWIRVWWRIVGTTTDIILERDQLNWSWDFCRLFSCLCKQSYNSVNAFSQVNVNNWWPEKIAFILYLIKRFETVVRAVGFIEWAMSEAFWIDRNNEEPAFNFEATNRIAYLNIATQPRKACKIMSTVYRQKIWIVCVTK